ncbi:MFS transporter [Lapillicoccus sp.]|uniref:MFS transporter n=1 Tax=Lapillicoccus sp. TaxID=1909287 RepID=UPI003266F1F5
MSVVQLSVYRPVLAIPAARNALLLGFFIRVPLFAGGIILTLHVVGALHRSYGAAGLLTAAATVALAVSSPWRGRLLDRKGLRRVVVPSLVVQAVCWSVAPWVDYWLLMVLAALAGLFAVPTFSVLRQVLLAAVPEEQRRTGLSLDSVGTEFSFMAGPALGVWAATMWHTSWAIFVFEWLSILAGIVLAVLNPVLRRADVDLDADGISSAAPARSSWFGLPVLAVLAAAAATTVVLAGSDVAIVATLRAMNAQQHIGWVLALWGAGSIVGGLVYGAWHESVPVFWLLGGLAVVTAPVALAATLPMAAVLLFVSGLFCAPTITATVDHLTRLVPERARGEAIGWHGSSMTMGMAIGAPIAGFAIDAGGWQVGFLAVSGIGLLVAVLGGGLMGLRGRRADPTDTTDTSGAERDRFVDRPVAVVAADRLT